MEQAPNDVVATPAPVVEMDLISKVAEFRKSQPVTPPPQTQTDSAFNYNEIENIKDPIAKEIAIKAYKSLQGDYTRKTQELAEQRKSLESKMQEKTGWTAQRIQQELLNNPEFLQAAQEIAQVQNPVNSGLTDEQFSALTDSEKAQLNSLKSEINQLKQTNANASFMAAVAQEDARLQARYSDYDPTQVNQAMEELSRMTPIAVREIAYKVKNHDRLMKEVYEMGKAEGRGLNQDKLNAFSPNGSNMTSSDDVPTKQAGETDQAFFLKLAQHRLAQSRRK